MNQQGKDMVMRNYNVYVAIRKILWDSLGANMRDAVWNGVWNDVWANVLTTVWNVVENVTGNVRVI